MKIETVIYDDLEMKVDICLSDSDISRIMSGKNISLRHKDSLLVNVFAGGKLYTPHSRQK